MFDVAQFGAAGDGRTKDTAAIQRAIDACTAAGGGAVYLPPGRFLAGTIVLKSNVALHLEAGATLLGSTDIADFAPPHLIYAEGAENIAIEGRGRIDGQGPAYWYQVPRDPAFKPERQGWGEIASFFWRVRPQPSQMIRLVRCRDVKLRDVTLANSTFWALHLVACDDATIRGITIDNPLYGPSTDGIDLDACRNVTVSDCIITAGDDAICLKNGDGGIARMSRNIVVTNCVITTTCNAFKLGTATRDGFENITFSNSAIYNEPAEPGLRALSGIAIESVDGGHVQGVVCSNITMQNVRAPIFIRLGNMGRGQAVPTPGTLKDVLIENVRASGAQIASSITGLPGHDVEGVALANIRITTEGGGPAELAGKVVEERPANYPECTMFGRLPASGFFCRHVRGLSMSNLELGHTAPDHRPAMIFDDVQDLTLDNLRLAANTGAHPLLRLVQVRNAFLHGACAPASAGAFLEVSGDRSHRIILNSCNLAAAAVPLRSLPGTPPGAVIQ